MSIPRSVADVVRQHVTLEVECIDRMYLNVYVPALQRAGGVATFLRFHLGHQFASSVLMDPISKRSSPGWISLPNKRTYRSCISRRDSARMMWPPRTGKVHRRRGCIVHR